jgi:hypothetical protein
MRAEVVRMNPSGRVTAAVEPAPPSRPNPSGTLSHGIHRADDNSGG